MRVICETGYPPDRTAEAAAEKIKSWERVVSTDIVRTPGSLDPNDRSFDEYTVVVWVEDKD